MAFATLHVIIFLTTTVEPAYREPLCIAFFLGFVASAASFCNGFGGVFLLAGSANRYLELSPSQQQKALSEVDAATGYDAIVRCGTSSDLGFYISVCFVSMSASTIFLLVEILVVVWSVYSSPTSSLTDKVLWTAILVNFRGPPFLPNAHTFLHVGLKF